jgi:hypothetical protein
MFAAGKSLHLVHYVYFCPLRPLEVFRAFQPVPLCVRFFPPSRFANARLRRIRARYYTSAFESAKVAQPFLDHDRFASLRRTSRICRR